MLKTGFDSERLREDLLKRGNINRLLSTYSSKYPEISDGNTAKFWDEKFSNDQEKEHLMALDRNNTVSNFITRGSKNLNLGAGNGYLEKVIYEKRIPIEWVGTDITKKTLLSLRKKFPNWKFFKEKLSNLSFSDESFDRVFLLEVLEHISPKSTFNVLAEIFRVLKRNGQFVVSVPVNEGLEEMFPNNPNQHLRIYSEKLLTFELDYAGFKIDKVIRLTAFPKHYYIKKFLNRFFNLRKPNNLIIIARKK